MKTRGFLSTLFAIMTVCALQLTSQLRRPTQASILPSCFRQWRDKFSTPARKSW